jgi:class 3 adenylate cyclase
MWSSMIWPVAVSAVTFVVFAFLLARAREQAVRVEQLGTLLKQMFGRYVSTEVMKSLLAQPASFQLGGERRRVTILMTDLRGFTALAERVPPEEVIGLLNAYFEVMVDVCLRHGGTINEIVGDALLVTFGAPAPMAEHTAAAVACAIEMQNAMQQVNAANLRDRRPRARSRCTTFRSRATTPGTTATRRPSSACPAPGWSWRDPRASTSSTTCA